MDALFHTFSLKDWLKFGDSCHWELTDSQWTSVADALKQDFSTHSHPTYCKMGMGVILVQQRNDFFSLLSHHSFNLPTLQWSDIRSYSVALSGKPTTHFKEYGIPFGGYENDSHYMCMSLGLSPNFGGWSGQQQVIENISRMKMNTHERGLFLGEILSNAIDASKYCSSVSNRELLRFVFNWETRLDISESILYEHVAKQFNLITEEVKAHVNDQKTKADQPNVALLQLLLSELGKRNPQCDLLPIALESQQRFESTALLAGCTIPPQATSLLESTIRATREAASSFIGRLKRQF